MINKLTFIGNTFSTLAEYWTNPKEFIENQKKPLPLPIPNTRHNTHKKIFPTRLTSPKESFGNHPLKKPDWEYYLSQIFSVIDYKTTEKRIETIKSLAKNDTVFETGVLMTVDSIQAGEKVTCIDLTSGKIIGFNLEYLGKHKFTSHVFGNKDEIAYDSHGLVIRKQRQLVKFSNYKPSGEKEIEISRDNAHDVINYLETNHKGQMFAVKLQKKDHLLFPAKYIGHHIDDDSNIVLWFDNGRCIEITDKLFTLYPLVKK